MKPNEREKTIEETKFCTTSLSTPCKTTCQDQNTAPFSQQKYSKIWRIILFFNTKLFFHSFMMKCMLTTPP